MGKRIINLEQGEPGANDYIAFDGDGGSKKVKLIQRPYLTEAPTADNPVGLIPVCLSARPQTLYEGYFYMIEEEG